MDPRSRKERSVLMEVI
jgi:hypothetical protein